MEITHVLLTGLLKSQLTNQNAEVTPQFSEHSWLTKENLLHLQWQKTFAEFDAKFFGGVLGKKK